MLLPKRKRLIVLSLMGCVNALATLIIEMPTSDGVVLCADRRVLMGNGQGGVWYGDDMNVKIFQLGSRCAYVITGVNAIFKARTIRGNQFTFESAFSVNRVVEDYFGTHPCSNSPVNIAGLQRHITETTNRFLTRNPEQKAPAPTFIIILHGNAAKQVERIECVMEGDDEGKFLRRTSCTLEPATVAYRRPEPNSGRRFSVSGDTREESQHMRLLGMSAIKEEPSLLSAFSRIDQDGAYSVLDAQFIARRMITRSSKYIAPGSTRSTISAECDCIQIPLRGGIQWLNKPVATGLFGRPDKE